MTHPKIEIGSKEKTDTLVLVTFQNKGEKKKKPAADAAPLPPEFYGKKSPETDALLKKLQKEPHFSGRRGETSLLRYQDFAGYPNLLLLGVGPLEKWSAEAARISGAALFLLQRTERLAKLTVDGESLLSQAPEGEADYYLQAFCEGYLLAGYQYGELHTVRPTPYQPKLLSFVRVDKNPKNQNAVKKADSLAESVNFARSLGDRPGNYASPPQLAAIVQKMAKSVGLKCTVFNKARIEREKMGLLLGVSQGSAIEPRFIILEHKGGGKKAGPPIALVGKGITFDTGGISLKPPLKMEEMKYDMMGSATVAGTLMAIAKLKLPINVTGYIAAAENMPGGKAQKPGDVQVSAQGKTVEIINTDAEGRLALADALDYAQKANPKPQAIVDYATLTGAVVVALGSAATGIMGNNESFLDRFRASSKVTGEKVWELPLFPEYEDFLRSTVADIKNSSDVREAGSSKAGTFLKFFIEDGVPWVHCDIAGSGMTRTDKNYMPRGFASGIMIRLTVHMLENWKKLENKNQA